MVTTPFPRGSSIPGIELGFSVLKADFLPYELPWEPTHGHISRENHNSKDTCTPLLTIAKIWKQTICPLIAEWIKMWYTHTHTHTHTMEYRRVFWAVCFVFLFFCFFVFFFFLLICLVTKKCLTLLQPMDYSLPGSYVHGIFQAKILNCTTISFSRGSSWCKDRTNICCIAGT